MWRGGVKVCGGRGVEVCGGRGVEVCGGGGGVWKAICKTTTHLQNNDFLLILLGSFG